MTFLNNSALLPLAPLTRTTSPQILWEQVRENIAKIPDKEIRQNTTTYTDILAGLKFKKDFIRQFLSEDVMQDSVTYQDILQKGEKQGEEKGVQKEALAFCVSLLNERFGEVDSSIMSRVRVLNKEQLEALGRALLKISSIADLTTWLDEN